MEQILQAICRYYGVPSRQIFANNRKYEQTIFYRHLFFYLCKTTLKNISYREIIEFAFRKNYDVKYNHATLINGIKRTADRIRFDAKVRKDVSEITDIIEIINQPDVVIKHVDLITLCAKNL